ncbi:hypothetical protein B0H16DRAFT_1752314 [Mycena metata]|uniref:Secreted protein n=1 Tax=Mycena metata TaxID=1033252 RepID=A0AAD7GJ45_9AGAR|nr:hypothetical protein B0H16DRAFT_1752314 [Mycena metata]
MLGANTFAFFFHHQLSLCSVVAVIAARILQASIQPPMALVSAPSASVARRLHNDDRTSIHIASASRGLKSLITLSPPLVTPTALSRHVGIKSDSAPVYVGPRIEDQQRRHCGVHRMSDCKE